MIELLAAELVDCGALSVYRLLPALDDPGIGCFGINDNSSVLGNLTLVSDFFPTNTSARDWKAPRFGNKWRKRKVETDMPGQVNDYPAIAMMVPTFSRRAVEILHDFLEPNGEILPLDSDIGPDAYFAYNVTTVIDGLDHKASEIEWDITYRLKKVPADKRVRADKIVHFEFLAEKVRDLSIFRLVEDVSHYYVTCPFVRRCLEHRLVGFRFSKVWPLPKTKKGDLP